MPDETLRIAIVSTPKTWGGGEQLAWTLGNGLTALGHSVTWITNRNSVLQSKLAKQGVECLTIRGKYPTIAELTRLRHQLHSQGIQTIYGNDSRAINWVGLLGFGLRDVLKIGVKHTIFPIKSSLKYNWFLDRVVCVSNASREVCIQGGIRAESTHTIYGGLNIPEYDRPTERKKIADSLGISHSLPLYCSVGSLIGCKGFDTVIQSASMLKRKGRKFMIAICGEGDLRESLQKQIDNADLNDSVRLVGFKEDPYRWIAASDMLLHPSRSEGLSLVTIAAQLLGTPVVATAIGGLFEVMHTPDTKEQLGWIVPQDSPSELAQAIVAMEKNTELRNQFTADAKLWANQRFLSKHMVNGVVQLIHESAKNRRHTSASISPELVVSLRSRASQTTVVESFRESRAA